RENLLKQDMSPGGQYFDNTYDQFTLDINGNQITNPSYNINAWIRANLADSTALIAAINTSGLNPSFTYHYLYDIRNNWVAGLENITIRYHPEYKLYEALC